MKKILAVISVFMVMASGCGTTLTKKEITGKKVASDQSGSIFLSSTKTYPGSDIEATVEFNEPLQSVSYGFKDQVKVSAIKPEGSLWKDTISIPELKPGKYNLIFVATPKNPPSKTFNASIEVVGRPDIKVTYDPKSKQKQNIVVTGTNIVKVVLVDGKLEEHTLIKSQKGFEINKIVQDNDKLVITDNNGLVSEQTIGYPSICVYQTKHNIRSSKRVSENSTIVDSYESFCRLNPHTGELKEYETINFPIVKDPYRDPYMPESVDGHTRDYTWTKLIGLSPDLKYSVYYTQKGLKPKESTIEDGRRLKLVKSHYFFICERKKLSYKLIGLFTTFYYDPKPSEGDTLIKEIGTCLYPVYWRDNELILVEATKDNKLVKSTDFSNYPRIKDAHPMQLKQTPIATAKYVSINLSDLTSKQIDEYAPLKPWVCWADQSLGVVGWMSPQDPFICSDAKFPTPINKDSRCVFVSDYQCKNVWNIKDELVKQYGQGYNDAITDIIGGSFWKGKKTVVFACLRRLGYNNVKLETMLLDIKTGLITKLKTGSTPTKEELDPDFSWQYMITSSSIMNPNIPPLAEIVAFPKQVSPDDITSPMRTTIKGANLAELVGDFMKVIGSIPDKMGTDIFIYEEAE